MMFMLPVPTWAMHLKDTQSCTVLASTSLWLHIKAFCSISDVHGFYFLREWPLMQLQIQSSSSSSSRSHGTLPGCIDTAAQRMALP